MPTGADDDFDTEVPPSGPGCVECEEEGGWWWHLRRCARCGHVGCCDGSLSTHARRHAAATGHPVVQSYEPDEDWCWDYPGEAFVDGPKLAEPTSHPLEQPAPGPAGRVPENWREILASR